MSYQPSAPPSYGQYQDEKTQNQGVAPYPPPNAPYPNVPYPPQQAGYPAQPGYGGYAYTPATGGVHSTAVSHPADTTGGEAGFTTSEGFNDKNVRRIFVRKVFIILGLQLLVTFGIVCIFTLVEDVRKWVKEHEGVYYAAYGVFFVLYIALVCVDSLRRKHPLNLFMLGIFTLALSYMTGTIAAFYDTEAVMACFGVTVLVCGTVILFSMQTKFDFTQCTGLIFVLCMTLFWFGFISIFTAGQNYYVQIVYGCIAALVFVLFLAFDVQLIMGGKKHELSEEEYVMGSLLLYVDIVYIFLILLSLFGGET